MLVFFSLPYLTKDTNLTLKQNPSSIKIWSGSWKGAFLYTSLTLNQLNFAVYLIWLLCCKLSEVGFVTFVISCINS